MLFRSEFHNVHLEAGRKAIKDVHDAARTLLGDLTRDGCAGYDVHVSGIITLRRHQNDATRTTVQDIPNRDAMSVRDRFIYRLVGLLKRYAGNIRACPALLPGSQTEQCGRVFLKVTQKEFCSEPCRSRMHQRVIRRRDRERNQEQLRRLQDGKATRKGRG